MGIVSVKSNFLFIQECCHIPVRSDQLNVSDPSNKHAERRTKTRKRQARRCAAKDCTNNSNNTDQKFFTFPATVKNNEVDDANVER